jgi:folate-dependent phosphoribosylglycinamide formyltransferase PurN
MSSPDDLPAVVLLGDRGPGTRAVCHALEKALTGKASVSAVLEEPPSRVRLARRRSKRLGWFTVAGQVAFVILGMPVLRLLGRSRIQEIETELGLDLSPIADPVFVTSVNDRETLELLRRLSPRVVVVHGTRIISEAVLQAIPAPFINVHAGITPRYRGVQGGYWALVDARPDLAGTTVHVVDAGIDTGGILGQATFQSTRRDSMATYPYLHLACGIPVLVEQVDEVLAGGLPGAVAPLPGAEHSQLRWHPTVWGYLTTRWRQGVR